MVMRSIHDSRVVSYEVVGEEGRIVLHTSRKEKESPQSIDVIFEGVLAYFFQHDNFGNILFGIEEVSLPELVEENASLFEEGSKYGWPGSWNDSSRSCLSYFKGGDGRAFEITSSYGLSGWVIARSIRFSQA